MPTSYSFLARSIKEIEHHFNERRTASLIYVIMAQSIADILIHFVYHYLVLITSLPQKISWHAEDLFLKTS